jgi:phospholipid/cholesterol/gamma-HCH transport system ATP-binding protein
MSIVFTNVTKSFGNRKILDSVSFTIHTGEIAFILGKSGVGKSVTLKNIVGLMKPDQGSIRISNIEVTTRNETEMEEIRKICGMVFQHPALLDSVTIFENIAFGLRRQKIGSEEINRRVREVTDLVRLDSKILNRKPPEISYGMQKRVSLARTLAPQPKYLLFDEPTTGLDPITTNAVNELIQSLSRELKVTSMVVSHDMQCALKIADRILVLDQGKIISNGTVSETRQSKNPLIVDFLLEAQ